jgi:hypothetical protein
MEKYMNNKLDLIITNLNEQNKEQSSEVAANLLASDFEKEILDKAIAKYKELIKSEEWSIEGFDENELDLFKSEGALSAISLKGFGEWYHDDGSYFNCDIEANFKTINDDTISFEATIVDSSNDDGKRAELVRLLFNGFDIDSFIVNADLEDDLNDFMLKNHESVSHYDINMKPLSEDDIDQISKILGLSI